MVLSPWFNRLPSFEAIERDFDRMLGAFFGELATPASHALPPVNVRDAGEAWIVELPLAGARADDFQVHVEGEQLAIDSVRAPRELPEGARVLRSERATGAFRRRVRLPTRVRAEDVEARYSDGVLHVTLPKAKESLPRAIKVQDARARN